MREHHTGLEVWLTPPSGTTQPPRWKMVVVMLLAVYPLILLVPLMEGWPVLLRTLVTSSVFVCLMTYAVMPLITRLFSRWLYGA